MNIFKQSIDEILSFLIKNKDFCYKNPKQLALLMKEYSNLFKSSQYHCNKKEHLNENPKYAILNLEGSINKIYMEFIYDAWCASSFLEEKTDHILDKKINKTIDDFIEMYLDPSYKYYGLFNDRKTILNHLLCSIGNGYDWSCGHLNDANLPYGTSPIVFYGFLEEIISNEILSICHWKSNEEVKECQNKMIQEKLKRKTEESVLSKNMKLVLKKYSNPETYKSQFSRNEDNVFVFNEISNYSKISTMPKNVEHSYLKACYEICELILSNNKESINNKEQALKIKRKLKKLNF